MRPTFAARMGSERIHDAPICWDGNVDVVHPYRPSHRDARIDMQLAHHDRFGHFYDDNIALIRQLERADENPYTIPDFPRQGLDRLGPDPSRHTRPQDVAAVFCCSGL